VLCSVVKMMFYIILYLMPRIKQQTCVRKCVKDGHSEFAGGPSESRPSNGCRAGESMTDCWGCADEDSAYISKRMLRVGTSEDARDSKLHVNTPKG